MEVEEYKKLLEQQSQLVAVMQQQMLMLQDQVKNVTSAEVKSRVSVPWPQPLEVDDGDPYENLTFFKSRWEDYCLATGMNNWSTEKEETKSGLLLSAIGSKAMKKYMDFGLSEIEKKSHNKIFAKMEEAIFQKTNVIFSRYLFNIKNQNEESFDEYLLALKKLAKRCNYKEFEEEILRDRIVVGIKDGEVIKELLKKQDLTLETAINICRASEGAAAQVADLQKSEAVNKISKNKKLKNDTPKKCKFCGGVHVYQKKVCPAWGQRCDECGGRNHFKNVCKKRETVKELHEDSDDSVIIAEVRHNEESGHAEAPLLFHIGEKKQKIYCTLDTGAAVCVMGAEYYKKLTGQKDLLSLTPPVKKLKAFNGSPIINYGNASFIVTRKNKDYKLNFHIVNVNHEPLLSEKACLALGFIQYCDELSTDLDRSKAKQIMKQYEDVFEGYGSLPGEVSLELDESIPARIQPARRVPVALKEKLRTELEQLEADGIIAKETQHTDWVAPTPVRALFIA
ncbi:uncharacterized protein LOC133527732 [Cydia pomonella]|uniref:uncharacterized protein LOC133518445 n=1 Tax=Cydia pomonella TaxID=82600 RepID=UPI002ADE1C2D|nr:uncharacterized protein LOC133518445 [Cydia pomonella]XP_061720865.1 uncharacterized protein LOC133527732 [Cydia pomonella]